MKLSTYTYLCQSCQEIFEFARHGRCPACESDAVFSLTRRLQPGGEQVAWLRRIGRMPKLPAVPPVRLVRRVEPENMALYLTADELKRMRLHPRQKRGGSQLQTDSVI